MLANSSEFGYEGKFIDKFVAKIPVRFDGIVPLVPDAILCEGEVFLMLKTNPMTYYRYAYPEPVRVRRMVPEVKLK